MNLFIIFLIVFINYSCAFNKDDSKIDSEEDISIENNFSLETDEDSPIEVNLKQLISDEGTLKIIENTKHGKLSGCIDKQMKITSICKYTPNKDYFGVDKFEVLGSNNSKNAITFKIRPVNDPPQIIKEENIAIISGQKKQIILDGAIDIDGDNLEYIFTKSDIITIDKCNNFLINNKIATKCNIQSKIIPEGDYSIEYKVSDGSSNSNSSFLDINVLPFIDKDGDKIPDIIEKSEDKIAYYPIINAVIQKSITFNTSFSQDNKIVNKEFNTDNFIFLGRNNYLKSNINNLIANSISLDQKYRNNSNRFLENFYGFTPQFSINDKNFDKFRRYFKSYYEKNDLVTSVTFKIDFISHNNEKNEVIEDLVIDFYYYNKRINEYSKVHSTSISKINLEKENSFSIHIDNLPKDFIRYGFAVKGLFLVPIISSYKYKPNYSNSHVDFSSFKKNHQERFIKVNLIRDERVSSFWFDIKNTPNNEDFNIRDILIELFSENQIKITSDGINRIEDLQSSNFTKKGLENYISMKEGSWFLIRNDQIINPLTTVIHHGDEINVAFIRGYELGNLLIKRYSSCSHDACSEL